MLCRGRSPGVQISHIPTIGHGLINIDGLLHIGSTRLLDSRILLVRSEVIFPDKVPATLILFGQALKTFIHPVDLLLCIHVLIGLL
jgi:hypothetical protein